MSIKIDKDGVITFESLFASKETPDDEIKPIVVKNSDFEKSNAEGDFATYDNLKDLYSTCKKSAKSYNIFK